MKLSQVFFTMILLLVSLSSYQSITDSKVNLIGLADKNFNFIIRIDKETTPDEINNYLIFINQYNSSVKINRSTDGLTGNVSLEIKSETAICNSNTFKFGIIALDKDNQCQCAIGDE